MVFEYNIEFSPKAQMWINVISIWLVGSNTRTQFLHIYINPHVEG
jgi:hypothetical protein